MVAFTSPPSRGLSFRNPEWLTTLTLEEDAGETTMKSRILYKSREARDGHPASGMKEGANESFDRLAEHLLKTGTDAAGNSPPQ